MNILVVSDTPETFTLLEKTVVPKGFTIFYSSNRDNIKSVIRRRGIRIIILRLSPEETDDLRPLREIRNFDPLIEVILAGPPLPVNKTVEAVNLGAADYVVEPFDGEDILAILDRIREKADLRRQTYRLEKQLAEKYVFEGMVGRSAVMLELFSLIERLAKFSSPVLIQGATGTGKEMVARALHRLSPRRERKLVVCDCTSIPESLFESELFGYERGAFTGADKAKPGIFEDSDGGTLFLDEIGDIPPIIQTKLLRVLEEHRFRPLGSNAFIEIDVRVICATNKNLRALISEGLFREDLFHRINLAEINLPALRERRDDILMLANHFLETSSRKFKKDVRGISQRAKRILANYDYPGNVRELENLIERAVMLSTEAFVDIKDLPEPVVIASERAENDEREARPYPFAEMTLEDIEKKHIGEILKAAGHNKVKAAKMLGLTRPALYRKLKKYSLS
ncbi:MAG: sigma-54 dependent transcriptional regulator [Acidobacteriota bacterium]|nr:sigma-54 dependent transcriptional regulator [Acidobacteriota bacterium]OQB54578.1 MAG: Transcriptional regulatory protein ZraR [Candidatus Aminicenantes bacterium ADurb.Bin147]HOS11332.1 sigma-54 dependent transcriptional regulator [Candidatus Aminicenantes bacterium]MDD8033099.1 sigma-54 dependent transcriptional regulator [Acidobacteriota bacterium]MDD8039929.1 sigma-54 dependent transcriptional regulator [Acidobacteriota bacterium]